MVLPPTMEAHGVEYGDECTDVPHTPIYDEIHHIPYESETLPPHLSESENMSELCATTTNESECISIERMSVTTTSPTYDEMPTFPCEESHNHHLSDSTICEFECIHQEGVSEPPHIMSEKVDRSCEATIFSNNLTSTSIVSSPLVLGLPYDDAHIVDEYPPHMEAMMAMEENDAPSPWFHQDDDVDHELVFSTSPTPLDWRFNGDDIGDGTTLVPLVDFDCLHDDDLPIAMPLACVPTTCFDEPQFMIRMMITPPKIVMTCCIGYLVLIP